MTGSIFGDGDIWIVPQPTHSTWFSRLDWYLNWQMCKGQMHRPAAPHSGLLQLAEEHGIQIDTYAADRRGPMMIAGGGLVPANSCVVLEYSDDLKNWLLEAKTIAFKMKAAQAKIFLPTDVDKDKAEKAWDKISGDCAAVFVEDTMENA